jgi:hypothetical protein
LGLVAPFYLRCEIKKRLDSDENTAGNLNLGVSRNRFCDFLADLDSRKKFQPFLHYQSSPEHLYIKCIILPRQARDKHRESTLKKEPEQVRHENERNAALEQPG